MPAVPEIGDRGGKEGLSEVLVERDAEHLGDADDDVDAAREVRVELGSVEQDPHEAVAGHLEEIVENRIHIERGIVGDDDLLEKAPDNAVETALDPGHVKAVLRVELLAEAAHPADRTLHDLGEEGEKEREPEGVPLRLDALPVDIQEIAGRLEGVEGDPEREEKLHFRNACPEDPVYGAEEEIRVLDDAQHPEIEHQNKRDREGSAGFRP